MCITPHNAVCFVVDFGNVAWDGVFWLDVLGDKIAVLPSGAILVLSKTMAAISIISLLPVSRSKATFKTLLQLIELGSVTSVSAKGSSCWVTPTPFLFRGGPLRTVATAVLTGAEGYVRWLWQN